MRIVIVFVDGLGYYHLTKEWTEDALWVHALRNQVPSITAPNWTSLLTGVSPQKHGLMDNRVRVGMLKHRTFLDDVVSSSVQVVSDWKPFRHLVSPHPFTHSRTPLRSGFPQASVTLLNLDRLDTRAHLYAWHSKQANLTRLHVAQELQAYRKTLSREPYVMFVLADHGGFRKNHEAVSNEQIRTIPFICYTNDGVIPKPKIHTSTSVRAWLKQHVWHKLSLTE